MGGKRPDQYAIDPGEAGATDYKDRHEDEHLNAAEKAKVVSSRKPKQELIPKRGENPEQARVKSARSKKPR